MPASLGEHGRALTTRGGSRRVGVSGFRALNARLPRTRPKPEFGTSQPHEVIGSPTWRCGVPSAVVSLTAGRSLNAATTHDAAAAISPTRVRPESLPLFVAEEYMFGIPLIETHEHPASVPTLAGKQRSHGGIRFVRRCEDPCRGTSFDDVSDE